jgi:hypothetical protein
MRRVQALSVEFSPDKAAARFAVSAFFTLADSPES